MDFSKLGRTRKAEVPVDPIRIFETLPSLEGTPNDLWRGQARALAQWHAARTESDVLISLNTGAGKTIVGLLIAQSMVNEGIQNVVYVCSTIDLVSQTAAEADRLGIPYTIRVKGEFNNDLFETGKGFCITTYHALFNGLSAIARKHLPGGVVFDDAHVAESVMRSAYTIRIDGQKHGKLFQEISGLFKPSFFELGQAGRFADATDRDRTSTVMVSPRALIQRTTQLAELLERHGVRDDPDLKYPYAHIRDHLEACAVVFSRGVVEIAPPFLPSRTHEVLSGRTRRVYLSATLQSKADFIRAFGRPPTETINPENDAGNGERLILDGRAVKGGFGPPFVGDLARSRKVLIAVPDYAAAATWSDISEPPDVDNFSSELNAFRSADNGAFILVNRVDGIDLPHDTCRIMLIDGLPTGSALLERFQFEYLRMSNVQAGRIANRLAQLFGRINRGRNDFGAFLLEGRDLGVWLSNDRNLALLPPLLQQQVLVGREVQKGFQIDSDEKAEQLIDRVLMRDAGWLDYYGNEVKSAELDRVQRERAEQAELHIVVAAASEAKFAEALWQGDYGRARRELEKTVDETARHDTPLGGWQTVWLAATYDLENDSESADRFYGIARSRLTNAISLPRAAHNPIAKGAPSNFNAFGQALNAHVTFARGNKFEAELEKLATELSEIDDGTPTKAEAAVRRLGELLGFKASRPDNDESTGPDVIWVDEANKLILAFELKTDKKASSTYNKGDIGQGHDHLEWLKNRFPGFAVVGLLFVGPEIPTSDQANPSDVMRQCPTAEVSALKDQLLAIIEDLRKLTPIERLPAIQDETDKERWHLASLAKRLGKSELAPRKR